MVLRGVHQSVRAAEEQVGRATAASLGLKPDPAAPGKLVKTGKGVLKRWSGRLAREIKHRDVVELLDAEVDRGAPVMANRTLAAVRKVFNWCIQRGVLDANPCSRAARPTAERTRDRVLTDHEFRLAWRAVDRIEAETESKCWPFAAFVKLLILTGQRRDEVSDMRRPEIDFASKSWTIPGKRRKGGKPHEVPLSDAAVAILKSVPHVKSNAGLVFTTTGETPISGYSRAKRRIDEAIIDQMRNENESRGGDAKKSKAPERWTLHDFRRTLATGLQRLGVRLEVTEAVIGHVSGKSRSGVVGIYQRHDWKDEKMIALDAWARHVAMVVEGSPVENNIVPMRG